MFTMLHQWEVTKYKSIKWGWEAMGAGKVKEKKAGKQSLMWLDCCALAQNILVLKYSQTFRSLKPHALSFTVLSFYFVLRPQIPDYGSFKLTLGVSIWIFFFSLHKICHPSPPQMSIMLSCTKPRTLVCSLKALVYLSVLFSYMLSFFSKVTNSN